MDPLATALDVETRLGRDLTVAEQLRIDALIADASANVRRVSTQTFTVVEDDTIAVRPSPGGRVRLPQRPVTNVSAVTDLNTNPVAFVRVNDELRLSNPLNALNAWELEPYRYGAPTEVLVTYDHGGDVPDLIVGVVCSIVARALGTAPDQAGVMQEAIDGYSYTLGSAAATGGIGMLPAEIAVCADFARPVGPISIRA